MPSRSGVIKKDDDELHDLFWTDDGCGLPQRPTVLLSEMHRSASLQRGNDPAVGGAGARGEQDAARSAVRPPFNRGFRHELGLRTRLNECARSGARNKYPAIVHAGLESQQV